MHGFMLLAFSVVLVKFDAMVQSRLAIIVAVGPQGAKTSAHTILFQSVEGLTRLRALASVWLETRVGTARRQVLNDGAGVTPPPQTSPLYLRRVQGVVL